jgi:hypothetical protein
VWRSVFGVLWGRYGCANAFTLGRGCEGGRGVGLCHSMTACTAGPAGGQQTTPCLVVVAWSMSHPKSKFTLAVHSP